MQEQISAFNPSKVNIITTTFYRRWFPEELHWGSGDQVTLDVVDKVRGDLALQTVSEGAKEGTRVIVIDGGSNTYPFREALERTGNQVLVFDETDHGMSASRQQGFLIAHLMSDGTANLWIEPEKVGMVKKECLKPVVAPILEGSVVLVIPGRDEEGFATLNNYQAHIEQESNLKWRELLIVEGVLPADHPGFDNWFGPRAWHKDITRLFLRKYKSIDPDAGFIKPEQYCNALHFPLITALMEGRRVLSVQVPFRYPETQQAIEQYNPEFEAKRRYQQTSILETTKEFIALLRGEHSRLTLIA